MGVKLENRPNKGWYVVIHHNGHRKRKFFGQKKNKAKEFASKLEKRLKERDFGIEEKSFVKFEDFAETWLERVSHTCKLSTYQDYQRMVQREFLPAFKGMLLKDITREKVKNLAYACLRRKLSAKTVKNIIRGLSSLFSHAVEDGLLTDHPALKPGMFLPSERKKQVNPLTQEEIEVVLETAYERFPRYYPILLTAFRTGAREGELLALEWDAIDFRGRFLEIRKNFARGKLTTPKNGKSRRVDMSKTLTQTLRDLQTERQLEAAANGWADIPSWVFCDEAGNPYHHNHLRKVFYRVLKAAGIRKIRFHDTRHSFATLLLQNGESMAYVKSQLGHSSIRVTVDLYYHWVPSGNKDAVDRLDKPVDKNRNQGENATQTPPRLVANSTSEA